MSDDDSNIDIQKIQQGFTNYHFQLYTSATGGDFATALELYRANIQLCEALYPCLHVMEMALRNSIHFALSEKYGAEWFLGTKLNVDDYEREEIEKVIKRLSRGNYKPSPDKVIAELTLGFWKSLIEKKSYENTIWKPCCRKIFVEARAKELNAKIIRPQIKSIHRLRNRVFHHECICFKEAELHETYENINKFIFWINPQLYAWLGKIDRFRSVSSDASDVIANKGKKS